MKFHRDYGFPSNVKTAVKAAKTLGFYVLDMTALGTWRTLEPINGDYVDYEGPFPVKRGAGPAFIRDDGVEVFMLNDTSRVVVTFEEDV